MNIGLYFGSFNPIHTGHLIIAQHFLNRAPLQQVWFVVSPQNPFKPSGTLLNEYHRLHLVRLGIGDHLSLRASDVEFHLPKPSYTSVTLAYLQEKYPGHQFSLLMGSDSYQNLPRWHNASYILQEFPLFLYVRPGFPPPQPTPERVTVLQAPLLDISASYIRELIRDRKAVTYLVPRDVELEMERNNYYRS
jgi:nicotinate-nucleotide adenylyltransferase